VPDAPHQALYVAQLDAAIGDEMRAILQHAQFKALEALWRGAHSLVSNLDTDAQLKLYLLDVSRDELLADMQGAQGSVESCALYRLLAEEACEIPIPEVGEKLGRVFAARWTSSA